MIRSSTSVRALLSVALLGAAGGCGNGLSAVKGHVTLDGKPVEHGTVVYYPVEGGAAAYGRIDDDGTYRLHVGDKDGVSPGNYVVTISSKLEQTGPDGSPRPSLLLTPKRYARRTQSDLKYEVVAGSNTIDLALTSDP